MAPSRTSPLSIVGLALLGSFALADPPPQCYFPDGTATSDPPYNQCDVQDSDDSFCCPLGSECLGGGLCKRSRENSIVRGACTTKGCSLLCEDTNPGGAVFIISCPSDRTSVCCASSREENCCADKFLVPGNLNAEDYIPFDYGNNPTSVELVTTTKTTVETAVGTSEQSKDEIDHDGAKRLVAIGAGLGVGGVLIIVAIVVLVWWHMRRKRRSRVQSTEGDKSATSSEGIGTSSLNTPIDVSHSNNFSSLPPSTERSQQQSGFDTFPPGGPRPPSSVSALPPYSPPQYESGDYQYLVVDGPAPSHSSHGPGSGSGGLPVGPDGKPRLEN